MSSSKKSHKVGRILTKILCFFLVTVLMVLVGAYSALYVLAKGPSGTASALFVRSVRETSAVGFLANLFFSQDEIDAMLSSGGIPEYKDTDTSMIIIPTTSPTEPDSNGPQPDAWGLIDEDGDGIILEQVNGEGYHGYMMVVLDPSRVIMATSPSDYGVRGYTVAEMVAKYDGVAGINAGGFYDPGGNGNGSIPDSMVVSGGNVYYAGYGCNQGFVGFDSNHILHVGMFTSSQVVNKGIQSGVSFGPVLISNGEPSSAGILASGLNPRSGIGQRSDGAILLLVIDGRQVTSLGATCSDMVDIFLSYGAVNAINLDGGSSSMMWYQGDYINHCASVVGIRPVPTAFVVLKEGKT